MTVVFLIPAILVQCLDFSGKCISIRHQYLVAKIQG